jgi:hypothetical protein
MRLADRLHHPAPQEQPLRHRLAPDVEVAVFEPKALVDRLVRLVDVEGRRLRLGQDVDLARLELDLTRRHAPVLGPRQPRRDLPSGCHDELVPDTASGLVRLRRVRLVDHDLGDAVAVTNVEEDQLAVIAASVDPARQARVDPGVGGTQLTGGMGAIGRGETRTGR